MNRCLNSKCRKIIPDYMKWCYECWRAFEKREYIDVNQKATHKCACCDKLIPKRYKYCYEHKRGDEDE